ncbi:MAG: exodeoxyribonuclease III [Candidatus Gracilibacteria bacterium]|nr:exodeoxyribonuclease III [Candidatus Gracilibacteria bacterium]
MKIISRNVNGIRSILNKGFIDFVNQNNPDFLCLQEVKAFEKQFIDGLGGLKGYKYLWHAGTKPGYAGTVIFYKKEIDIKEEKNFFGKFEKFHIDGRVTQIETDDFILLNAYFPNGGTRSDGKQMLDYKLDFFDDWIKYIKKLEKNKKHIILAGDFNVIHTENDIKNPKGKKNSICFLPVERDKFSHLLKHGYIDIFRHLNPDTNDIYSWWSYRIGYRERNIGWRVDYFLLNESIVENVLDIVYLKDVMGSDHCPVKLELK